MTTRLRRQSGANPFEESDAAVDKATRAVFGDIFNEPDRTVAIEISIFDITPDPVQPRRAIPSAVRAEWDGQSNAGSISVVPVRWRQLAEAELGAELPIYLATEPTEDYTLPNIDEATTPISYKLMKLIDLANDIYHHGLVEPIHVVVNESGGYRGESGERRWWAHWFLFLKTSDPKWTKINAFVRDEFSVWRQASENGARDPLNAIAMTRQLARLLMDIHKEVGFSSYADLVPVGGSDRAYYAQVASGDTYRIPRGWGEKIAAAMGLPNTQMLRQYRALLRLPDDIWIKGDDENWTENALRPYTVSTDTGSGNGKGKDKPKPRPLNEDEIQFNACVRSLLAMRRFDEPVNIKLIEQAEAFFQQLRDKGLTFTPEPKR